MATPILNITELFSNQKDQFAVVNKGLRQMEAAGNDLLAVDLSSGDETLSSTQFRRHFLFDATGHSVARELTVPQQKRLFAVRNSGSDDLSVVRGTTSHTVPAGKAGIFYADGTADGLTILQDQLGDQVQLQEGTVTISAANDSWFRSDFESLNFSPAFADGNYAVLFDYPTDAAAQSIGRLIAYDKAGNGCKVRATGSAGGTVRWVAVKLA